MDAKKYLGVHAKHPRLGLCKVVAVTPYDGYLLLQQLEPTLSAKGWVADRAELSERLSKTKSTALPIQEIIPAFDAASYFWWVEQRTSEFSTIIFTKREFVYDLEDLAELEQAKEAQKKLARSQSSQWRSQRDATARAVLGVRKSRW